MNYLLPSKTDELWRRTSPDNFSFIDSADNSLQFFILTKSISPGIYLLPVNKAFEKYSNIINNYNFNNFSNSIEKFVLDKAREGYFIYVAPDTEINENIILSLNINKNENSLMRNIIIIDKNAKLTLVEDLQDSSIEQLLFTTHIFAEKNSIFNYKRIWKLKRKTYSGVYLDIFDDARVNITTKHELSSLNKIEEKVNLIGNNAHYKGNYANLVYSKGHLDFTSIITHSGRNTDSKIDLRGVVQEKGYSLHHGIVRIEKNAFYSDTYYSSKHLLLTENGKANSIPKMEINNNEVKAGHGSTIGTIDKDSLFYLMSRGLNKKQAEEMLIEAFLNPIIESFPETMFRTNDFNENPIN